MPAIKSIQINPDLLNISSSKNKTRKSRKKKKEKKPKPHIKPNTLKKALLRRIKEHSNKERKKIEFNNNKSEDDKFSSDFSKHLEYLSNLSTQHKHNKKKKNKTLKTHSGGRDIMIHTELPSELNTNSQNNPVLTSPVVPNPIVPNPIVPKTDTISKHNFKLKDDIIPIKQETHIKQEKPITSKDPPYSCLKGGSKPTYREWKRLTQKNIDVNSDSNSDDSNQVKISDLRERIKANNEKHNIKPKTKTYKRKTIRRKYKFGKNKGKISVLVKNNKTRKLVQKEVEMLRAAPIKEVKEYLKKHYLYKSGSNAPNDILRRTYLDAHLSGEINNKSTENLVHNYLNQ